MSSLSRLLRGNMILSEEEARVRWCPQARSVGWMNTSNTATAIASNRDHPSGNMPACIASSCAFWRWAEEKKIRDIDLVTSDVVDLPPRRGFCGIAGKPEFD